MSDTDHAYREHPDVDDSFKRIHGNSEETHVFVFGTGGDYLVLAMDIDPRDYSAVAAEAIEFEPTREGAMKRAKAWMQENPKGIEGGSSGRKFQRLRELLGKLDNYGNEQVEEMQ